jgi:hypothetical protein
MPEITVCFSSASRRTWNVGSSSASLASDEPILSSSPLLLGSTAMEIAAAGKAIGVSTTA